MRTISAPIAPKEWAELVGRAREGELVTCQGTTDDQDAELERIARGEG